MFQSVPIYNIFTHINTLFTLFIVCINILCTYLILNEWLRGVIYNTMNFLYTKSKILEWDGNYRNYSTYIDGVSTDEYYLAIKENVT